MQSNPESVIGPINPTQAAELQTQRIPSDVYDVFNSLIAQALQDSGVAVVYRAHVVERLENRGLSEEELGSNGYLDVEPHYRDQGWDVEYRLDPDGCDHGSYLFTDPFAIEAVRRFGREISDAPPNK